MSTKIKVKLSGQNGNVFNLLGVCASALKKAGKREEAKELTTRVMNEAHSYMQARAIMGEYCEIR